MTAINWTNVGPEEEIMLESGTVDVPIDNHSQNSTVSVIEVEGYENFMIESVTVVCMVREAIS